LRERLPMYLFTADLAWRENRIVHRTLLAAPGGMINTRPFNR
jgi:hypothetical protein